MTEKAKAPQDWMVIVRVAGGAGTWARGRDLGDTLQRCKRMLKADWKSLYDFKKGSVVKANVFEPGGNEVEWGDQITVDGKPFEGKLLTVELVF